MKKRVFLHCLLRVPMLRILLKTTWKCVSRTCTWLWPQFAFGLRLIWAGYIAGVQWKLVERLVYILFAFYIMPFHASLFNYVWHIKLMFEWIEQHLWKRCMQFVQRNLNCMKMELCVQVGLWIQVYNVSFRVWWWKANLGEGHRWQVDVLWYPLLSEIPPQNFLGLLQLSFIRSQNSSPYPTRRGSSLQQHQLFVSSWRDCCVVCCFFNGVDLRTPPLPCSYCVVSCRHQAVLMEFSFTKSSRSEVTCCLLWGSHSWRLFSSPVLLRYTWHITLYHF